MSAVDRVNLLDFNRKEMEVFFVGLGEKSFRASQVIQWMHRYGVTDFEVMTNLGRNLRERLRELAVIAPPRVVLDRCAADGTRKWLMRLGDGNAIETVFIPDADRGTLCVSSQVGCALNCSFCSTGAQGFNRNLSVAEIIGQVWVAHRALGQEPKAERLITNVVMMGMGEPLLNFDNVVKAMDLMLDDLAYGLAWRRVTLSTAGVVPALDLLRQVSPVNLAVSLHAPTDELRDQLVPLNRKYPVAELMDACRRYLADDHRRSITFEYVMLRGVNDGPEHARALVRLLRGMPAKVNLIPFNPFPHTRFARSPEDSIDRFRDILMQAGLIAITRKTRGDDIDAACGQLVGQVMDRTRRSRRLPGAVQLGVS